MKIAMSSYSGMGAWFVLRLLAEGHDVDYFLSKPEYEDVLSGLIPKVKIIKMDQRRHVLGYGFPSYKKYDLSLFDLTGTPKLADSSRNEVPTFGDGTFETMLEDDREFGIKAMEGCGINVPPYQRFDNASEAKVFLKKNDKPYVYKPFESISGSDDKSLTYVAKSAADLIEYIDLLWEKSKRAPFILQEFIKGTEMGTAGYFNGSDFYLLTGTLEEKKFMNDNKGPNTGCSGNLVFAITDEAKIFKEGLSKVKSFLQAAGFHGIIDLNTIVTEDKIYGLEWTPRFGYVSDPTIATMYGTGFGEMLYDIASGKTPSIKWEGSFGAAVTISIPPYPTEIRIPKAKGVPIEGIDPRDKQSLIETYLYDAKLEGKKLITSGNYGYIGAVTASGHSIEAAFKQVEGKLKGIHVPNCQYRTDIQESTTKRYNQLLDWGWLR
jgi:phosphoribosylamine--glycine ligase